MTEPIKINPLDPNLIVKSWSLAGRGELQGWSPVGDQQSANGGIWQDFDEGMMWEKGDKIGILSGMILDKYRESGGPTGFLGFPIDIREAPTPDGIGSFVHFEYGGIYLYVSSIGNLKLPAVHEVHGAIWKKWSDQGWEQGDLGYPTSDEQAGPRGIGRASSFQHGWIYWTPASGAFETVGGAIPDQITIPSRTPGQDALVFKDNTPVGGWATVTLNSDGTFTFAGHLHDSGFPDYQVSASCAVIAIHTGTAFVLQHSGSVSGDSSILSGSRDMDWNDHGSNPNLTAAWLDLNGAKEVTWRLDANTTLANWIEIIKEAYPYVQTAITLVGL
ncbi:hypothetical protein [Nocardia sp. NPDC046763]|uniref:LGFP repeat-containing protein n=1 Tax=Nocardia sp. NPDC046763 TaxID=3155256 RepID=UPI0033E039E7